eukprot:gnl/Chilomastix_caulleri/403.p1 GENE.gnl/Chilomastix_caulleri/403~~gnl/Chilomastix_caulleri/403.p1  ORF type:complete len:180 (+),score=54.63 gnl/Chilomastix_caulleri/403:97-636(+)
MSLEIYKTLLFLAKMFNMVDTDHSYAIDYEEFKALLKELEIEAGEEEMMAAFAEVDGDGSGLIDFFEFIELIKALGFMDSIVSAVVDVDLSQLGISAETSEPEFFMRLLFFLADYEDKGSITFDQFSMCIKNILNFLGVEEEINNSDLVEAFEETDTDKSGTVEYDEFVTMVRKIMASE